MAKHKRRGSTRSFTVHKAIKLAIAFGPVAAKSLNAYSAAGGGLAGIRGGVLPAITTSYSGFNTNDGKFYPQELAWGYLPLIAAKAFGWFTKAAGVRF